MSQEIINVLNYIGEKIGIAIDWTADNVMPQILDILGRYRIFQIVGLSIWLLVFIVLAPIFVRFGKSFINNYKSCSSTKEENSWFTYNKYCNEIHCRAPSGIYIACLIIFSVFALICIPIIISELLEWILIPEIQYLYMLKGYMK